MYWNSVNCAGEICNVSPIHLLWLLLQERISMAYTGAICASNVKIRGQANHISFLLIIATSVVHHSLALNQTCNLGTLVCGSSVTATTVGSSCTDAGNTASPEITYNFTLSEDSGNSAGVSLVTFDTCGSLFDTVLRIYDSHGVEFSFCDDCGPCGLQAAATVLLVAGNYTSTYRAVVLDVTIYA